ncbi:MAG: zinc ribbon domain-containing protein, partial [Deltaproteobacteria bacterium]
MTASTTLRCPACGVSGPGANFCNSCGASLGAQRCPACGAEVPADSRFCGQCGTLARGGPAGAPPGVPVPRRPLAAMAVGGVALLGIVLVTLVRKDGGQAPAPAGAALAAEPPAGAPPDISAMSPRERFDRLYNR